MGTHSDAGMAGAILSGKEVATRGLSSHYFVTKINKEVQGKINSIRDQRIKKVHGPCCEKRCEIQGDGRLMGKF